MYILLTDSPVGRVGKRVGGRSFKRGDGRGATTVTRWWTGSPESLRATPGSLRGTGAGFLTAVAKRVRPGSWWPGFPYPAPFLFVALPFARSKVGNSSGGGLLSCGRRPWLFRSVRVIAFVILLTSMLVGRACKNSHVSPFAHVPRSQNRHNARSKSWLYT